MPVQALALLLQAMEEIALSAENALCVAIGDLAGLGRLDDTARAVDQLAAEALLERSDRQRDGGLRDAELLGGLRETGAVDDGDQSSELLGVHQSVTLRVATVSRTGALAAAK